MAVGEINLLPFTFIIQFTTNSQQLVTLKQKENPENLDFPGNFQYFFQKEIIF